jgi:hypothetical protein
MAREHRHRDFESFPINRWPGNTATETSSHSLPCRPCSQELLAAGAIDSVRPSSIGGLESLYAMAVGTCADDAPAVVAHLWRMARTCVGPVCWPLLVAGEVDAPGVLD